MLISCNECARQISDKAASCPGCGAPVESKITSVHISSVETNKTRFETTEISKATGYALISLGVLLLLSTPLMLLLFIIPGIISIVFAIVFISLGRDRLNSAKIELQCPYCDKAWVGGLSKDFINYECVFCKKLSIRNGDYLEVVRN